MDELSHIICTYLMCKNICVDSDLVLFLSGPTVTGLSNSSPSASKRASRISSPYKTIVKTNYAFSDFMGTAATNVPQCHSID